MKRLSWVFALAVLSIASTAVSQEKSKSDAKQEDGWIKIFNGKNLDGWKTVENEKSWSVEDGMIVGRGERSHLFYAEREFEDLEFKADIKLAKSGNSGMYFRTKMEEGWPPGYEAQVNKSSPDPRRTGSLYRFADVKEQLVKDDEWWTQHVIAKGNHIIIKVNGKTVVDFVDDKETYKKGYIALQQHDPGSVVHYKNLMVKPLGEKK